MDWFLLTLCGYALFVVRDAKAWAAFRPGAPGMAHGATLAAVCLALGVAAETVSRSEAQALLRDARLWAPALALHAALWAAFERAKRASAGARWPAWLFAVPAPAFVYSLGGACWLLLYRTNLGGAAAGLAVALATLAFVHGGAALWRRRIRPQQAATRTYEFGAASNLAAFLLIPLHQESGESAVLAQAVDWRLAALGLGATAALVGGSFAFHRLRARA